MTDSVVALRDVIVREPAPVPLGFERVLDADARFRRDTAVGRILHAGTASFREVRATGSLHIIVDGPRLSAHVDEVCPLDCDPDGGGRHYRWTRVVAHNVADLFGTVLARVTGRQGAHRCNLECEMAWVDDAEGDAE